MKLSAFLSTTITAFLFASAHALDSGWEFVTYGSTIKLAHAKSSTRLTLPQVSYGTGSQQQAISATSDPSSTRSFWMVEPEVPNSPNMTRGLAVDCNSKIRLLNSDAGFYLHSHAAHKSPISGNQEVSGFDGVDNGDVWIVECKGQWRREEDIALKHMETGKYLVSLPNKKYRHPIDGHHEVVGYKKKDSNAQWLAMEGYYFTLQ